jgi:hypothetical protein
MSFLGLSDKTVKNVLTLLAILLVVFVIYKLYQSYSKEHFDMEEETEEDVDVEEGFEDQEMPMYEESMPAELMPEESMPMSEQSMEMMQAQNPVARDMQNAAAMNMGRDQLTANDLLPQDKSSVWASVNPEGDGSLGNKNFLQAGFHIGINTVGQTLRNANLQLRSEPPNPQVQVSPWLQSTIEPDVSRRPMEIGGCM